MSKTISNANFKDAKKNTPDVQAIGDGDAWVLVCKAWSEGERWMKSTKAMEIAGVGCLVQVTTQQGEQVAEAVCFVPGIKIAVDDNGFRRLTHDRYQR